MRIIQGVFGNSSISGAGYKIEAHQSGGYKVVNRQGRTVRHFATRGQAQNFITKRMKGGSTTSASPAKKKPVTSPAKKKKR